MSKKLRFALGQPRRAKTPTVLQLEAAECGAASLAMVLGHFGRHVPLETLRQICGVSRDGSKASNILRAARTYGLEAKGLKVEPEQLDQVDLPCIAFVDFCHFLVVEGFDRQHIYLNDPANGRRRVSYQAFDEMFTGVILTFDPSSAFQRSDERPSIGASLLARTRGIRSGIAYVLLASVALVIPGLILPVLSRVFVDHILVRGLEDWIGPLLIGMIATAIVRFGLAHLQMWYLAQSETRLAIDGAKQLISHILRLPVTYFGTRYAGEVADRLHLSDSLAEILTGDVTRTVLSIVTALFFLALMIVYSLLITVCVVALSLFNVVIVWLTARALTDSHRKLAIDAGKLNGVTLAGLRDVETYKASGTEDAFFARWSGLNARVVTIRQQIAKRLIIMSALPQLITALTAATVLIVGGFEVMRGEMTIGTLVAFQTLTASFVAPVVALTGLGAKFQEVRTLTERTDDVLRHPTDPIFDSQSNESARLPDGNVKLSKVSFGYVAIEQPLIKELDLAVSEGGRIALVGPSGSGKSTVGRIIVGLLEPSKGDVLIGGEPIHAWPRDVLASRLAYIDQETMLFEGTIFENLTLWDATIPQANVIRAAQDAEIHDVISQRPGTYTSFVEEDGRNFSGGQRQRLEIARALATNPELLVMDEATSALDPITEARIMANIARRGVTVVIIAHRLSTIRDCDEIIVIDQGCPVERGTHDELMSLGGRYHGLIEV